jgi:hypothetical protein
MLYLIMQVGDWIYPAQDRGNWETVINVIIKFRVTLRAKNVLTRLTAVRF